MMSDEADDFFANLEKHCEDAVKKTLARIRKEIREAIDEKGKKK
jgi:hypothetical protein